MILVTGATGLLGSHILFELINNNEKVTALKRSDSDIRFVKKVFSYYSDNYEALFQRIIWAEGDITDINSLYEVMADIEYVYHTAAIVSFNHKELDFLQKVNAEGTANVVNVCLEKNIKKLCYTSSVAALGRESTDKPMSESTPWDRFSKKSAYSQTKYNAEQEVWRGAAEGLKVVMVNPSIILGPGNWQKGSSKLFETIWNGQMFYTRGINGFVDVRDVARIMIALMKSNIEGERFIVSSENLSYQTVLTEMAIHLNKKTPKFYAGPFLSNLAWRFEYVKSLLTGNAPLITKETAYTAHNKHLYTTEKIINALDYKFIPVSESIKDTAKIFVKEHKEV